MVLLSTGFPFSSYPGLSVPYPLVVEQKMSLTPSPGMEGSPSPGGHTHASTEGDPV
jgi:hypothetical protein